LKVALYLRVSTARQAEKDLSIPGRRNQLERWSKDRGWSVVAEYVEPGASATDDRRPQFQRGMDDATRLTGLSMPCWDTAYRASSATPSSSKCTAAHWKRTTLR
jgi:Resolvase, N terminal domain